MLSLYPLFPAKAVFVQILETGTTIPAEKFFPNVDLTTQKRLLHTISCYLAHLSYFERKKGAFLSQKKIVIVIGEQVAI